MTQDLPTYVPLGPALAGAMAETERLHAALVEATRRARALSGSLSWRVVRGTPHLVHEGPAGPGDRRTVVRVVGARSPATEAGKARFEAEGPAAAAAVREAIETLDMRAAANASARLGTVPAAAGEALRAVHASAAGGRVRAAGAAALYGYAALARARMSSRGPVDPLAPLAERLALVADGLDAPALCAAMRASGTHGYAARSPTLATGPDGYAIEVLPGSGDAAMLLGGIPVTAVAIDVAGRPVPVACPPIAAYVAERLRRGRDSDDVDGAIAIAQARAATACPDPVPGAPPARSG